ncbi:MAG: sensor domain-containing diguanylate cyclase [Candidatus Omnitrophica bacterium]|nr:sensor domain-containing diguanylate cyclase [Candidatus Omnitrophota bacterium]
MTDLNEQNENLEKTRRELSILYEVSNLMRTTLNLKQIHYIILTALTSHEGLGFNRAMIFLVNEKNDMLEGIMGIGPHSGEEADRIWRGIEQQRLSMEDIINAYDKFIMDPDARLNSVVRGIKVPLEEEQGVLALTILEGMPFEITNDEARKKINPNLQKLLKTEYFVTIPLKSKDKVLGAILVDNVFTKKPITKSDIRILTMFGNHVGLAIENSRLYEKTVLLSKTDWLTKLWNSGEFHKRLGSSIEKAKLSETPLSLVMIDVDNFKIYNDTLGHQKGDAALRRAAQILNEKSRQGDIVTRYGGEEFCIIMPYTDNKDAKLIAERLREEIETFFTKHSRADKVPILTISLGIASFPKDASDKNGLIDKADNALYEAKKSGKNKTCVYRRGIKKFLKRFKG